MCFSLIVTLKMKSTNKILFILSSGWSRVCRDFISWNHNKLYLLFFPFQFIIIQFISVPFSNLKKDHKFKIPWFVFFKIFVLHKMYTFFTAITLCCKKKVLIPISLLYSLICSQYMQGSTSVLQVLYTWIHVLKQNVLNSNNHWNILIQEILKPTISKRLQWIIMSDLGW